MAQAGYDPRAAVQFWQNMAQAGGGRQVPTFLSTHPADQERIAQLEEFLPEALAEYRPQGEAPATTGRGGWVFGPAR
jgi:predicted Zn-dependent protease